jgi:predicted small secreted protein
MKRMSKLVAVLLLILVTLSSCATVPVAGFDDDDPFGPQLADMAMRRENWRDRLFWSVIASAAGFLATSTFITLDGMGVIDENLTTPLTVGGYGLTTAGIGFGVWSYIEHQKATDEYLETLRLSTQYYNLIDVGRRD